MPLADAGGLVAAISGAAPTAVRRPADSVEDIRWRRCVVGVRAAPSVLEGRTAAPDAELHCSPAPCVASHRDEEVLGLFTKGKVWRVLPTFPRRKWPFTGGGCMSEAIVEELPECWSRWQAVVALTAAAASADAAKPFGVGPVLVGGGEPVTLCDGPPSGDVDASSVSWLPPAPATGTMLEPPGLGLIWPGTGAFLPG